MSAICTKKQNINKMTKLKRIINTNTEKPLLKENLINATVASVVSCFPNSH